MVTIPPLPEAETLVGPWTVREEGAASGACRLVLHDEQTLGGHRLEADQGCLASLGLDGAVAWRAAPDGIALTKPDQLSVAFFSQEGVRRYVARQRGRPTPLVLEPSAR